MSTNTRVSRRRWRNPYATGCCAVLLAGLVAAGAAVAGNHSTPPGAIDKAAISALPTWHGIKARVLLHRDLTRPFGTVSQWTLVVARDPGPSHEPQQPHARIADCFVHMRTPHCPSTLGKRSNGLWWYRTALHLGAAKVVYAGRAKTQPLLLVRTGSGMSVDGGHLVRTTLYAYNRHADAFRPVFDHATGSNNNQETRFVSRQPLRGDVIVAWPTSRAPYTYWVEVYAPGKARKYERILRYRDHTRYNDGNGLAVIDSEMPSILHHLGFWNSRDSLPDPLYRPAGCTHLLMRDDEEWRR